MIGMNELKVMHELAGNLYHQHDHKELAEEIMEAAQFYEKEQGAEVQVLASIIDNHLDSAYYEGRKDATAGIIQSYKATIYHYIKGKEVSAEGLAAIRSFELTLQALSYINCNEKKFEARNLVEIAMD